MSSWTTLPNYSVGQPLSVSKMDQTMDNFIVAGCHGHTGAAGDGATIGGSTLRGGSGIQNVYQYETILPFLPASQSATNSNAINTGAINGGFINISGNGASAKYCIDADAGTWSLLFYYKTLPTGGIFSACFNGASIGQVDTYSSGGTNNNLSVASTFSISGSGQYILKVEVVSKNISSIGYDGDIHHIELRRLSA